MLGKLFFMSSSFSKIFSKGFSFGKKDRSVLGIDLGSSSVKIVQLRNDGGQAILETYGEMAIGPYQDLSVGQASNILPEKLSVLMKDLFKEAGVTSNFGGLSIPLKSSLLINLDLPEANEEELSGMVPIEVRKYVPVPISETITDWWVVPKTSYEYEDAQKGKAKKPANRMNVLVAVIHKDTVSQYKKLSNSLSLENPFFEIETFSVMRSVLRDERGAILIVDLGATTTKVTVIDYGSVRVSHTINKGGQDITIALSRGLGLSFPKAEEIKRKVGLVETSSGGDMRRTINPIIEYIFSEVTKVMVKYQEKNARSVEKVFLIGGGALLKGLFEVAKDNIYAPVFLGTPFDRTAAPEFLADMLKQTGPAFAVSIGVALRALEEE